MKRCPEPALALLCLALAACASAPPQPQQTARRAPASAVAAEDGKGNPQARFAAALQLMKEGRRDEAENALVVLSQDFPQFSGPATDLGILYAQAKKRSQAIAAFGRAVQANPQNAVALNWLGVLYRESGDYARAEQYYQKAIAAKPDYAAAYFNLAILYDVALRRPQDALVQYRKYQTLAGLDDKPMVGVWIRELEARNVVAGGGVPAGAQK